MDRARQLREDIERREHEAHLTAEYDRSMQAAYDGAMEAAHRAGLLEGLRIAYAMGEDCADIDQLEKKILAELERREALTTAGSSAAPARP